MPGLGYLHNSEDISSKGSFMAGYLFQSVTCIPWPLFPFISHWEHEKVFRYYLWVMVHNRAIPSVIGLYRHVKAKIDEFIAIRGIIGNVMISPLLQAFIGLTR